MSNAFWAWAETEPDRRALVTAEGDSLTFGELGARVNQLSRGLQALGLSRGDGVAIMLNNHAEWVEAYLATHQVGLYLTAINYHLTGPEVAYILSNCEAKVFITEKAYEEAAQKAVAELDFDRSHCFSIDALDGFGSYEALLEPQPTSPPEERSAGNLMLYTSGTTGRPKGVRRPLADGPPEASAAMSAMLGMLFDIKPGSGTHYAAGPLYHAAPSGFAMGAMHMGQAVVLSKKWDAEDCLKQIQDNQVTATHMVPTMFHRLLELPQDVRDQYDVSSLSNVIHAAAPCPADTKRKMIDWFGPVIYEYYAATEGGGAYVNSAEWLENPGTVGKAWPGAQLLILDDDGNELPANEVGTIYMTSPMGEFKYFKDEKKTAESTLGSKFTVGDMGYLTEGGWLFICDRKSDMIISGGVNIYPAEVEAVLHQHPKIGDVAVLGVPDDNWGESVKAVVEVAAGVEASDELVEEILAFAAENLAKFKLPRSVDFMDALPRLPTGKLYKRLIRDKYWEGQDSNV